MVFKLVATSLLLALPIDSAKVSVVTTPLGMVRKVLRRKGGHEQANSLSPELEHKCSKQHPAHHADVANMTNKEIMACYAQFHEATLNTWRAETSAVPWKCDGRHIRVFLADHGLGDSGGNFVYRFQEAVMHGDMIFWLFPTEGWAAKNSPLKKTKTVWQHAMDAPFDWSLNANKDLFCLENDTVLDGLMEKNRHAHLVGGCPKCKDPRITATPTALQQLAKTDHHDVFANKVKDSWEFLYRPTADVQKTIEKVLGQVKSGEVLVGVHFRSQWFGEHFACGCMDPHQLPKCMTNLGEVMQQRNVSGFESKPRLRYFVASDSFAGVDAFRETYGEDVLTMPGDLPLEHALFCSEAGAKRTLAEFWILSKAHAILGTCGSTFTERVMLLSGIKQGATITTGTNEAQACAGLKNPTHDLKAFQFSRFASQSWDKACYCHGGEHSSSGGGTCVHACNDVEQTKKRPPLCKGPSRPSLIQDAAGGGGVPAKPAWVPQERL